VRRRRRSNQSEGKGRSARGPPCCPRVVADNGEKQQEQPIRSPKKGGLHMKGLSTALVALIGIPVLCITLGFSSSAEGQTWKEITSATDTSDFKCNCEYSTTFEVAPGARRTLFMNFVGVGETGYPGVTSIISADASQGQNFRMDNTEKDAVKFADESYPARVFERCHRRLPKCE
jgi:hypothetical protein